MQEGVYKYGGKYPRLLEFFCFTLLQLCLRILNIDAHGIGACVGRRIHQDFLANKKIFSSTGNLMPVFWPLVTRLYVPDT